MSGGDFTTSESGNCTALSSDPIPNNIRLVVSMSHHTYSFLTDLSPFEISQSKFGGLV